MSIKWFGCVYWLPLTIWTVDGSNGRRAAATSRPSSASMLYVAAALA